MSRDVLHEGLSRIESTGPDYLRRLKHYRGESPAAFLSKNSQKALDDRLRRLSVNFPRLAVGALADRLTIKGFLRSGKPSPLWEQFRQARGPQLANMIHADRLTFGSAYVTVWATETGRPTLTGDTQATMTHDVDPATGQVLWAVRRWRTSTDTTAASYASVYTPDTITRWKSSSADAPVAGGWKQDGPPVDNVLGVVPVVPFVRRHSLSDSPIFGASIVDDIADLTDATAKLLSDAMVTSEYFARPRRWATGLEIEEDEDGNPIDPFGESRLLQSESPETKFGQLDASRLDGYSDLIATLTQQIGSLTGIPPHYLGLHGDQPPNADGVKAAETQLVSRAYDEQLPLTDDWSTVAWLLDAVVRKVPALPETLPLWSVHWDNPEIRTDGQAADAAIKQRSIGVPLDWVLRETLRVDPGEVDDMVRSARTDAVLRITSGGTGA